MVDDVFPTGCAFWKKNVGLKWIESHTQISSICVIGLRYEIFNQSGAVVRRDNYMF